MLPPPRFPNLLSRIALARPFARQFVVPPSPPGWLARGLSWYQRRVLDLDLPCGRVDRPIFLVGLHRSGTTMVQDLLCQHPDVAYFNNSMSMFPECFCAAEHFRRRLRLDCRGERMLGDSVEAGPSSANEGVVFWRAWLGEDPHQLAAVRRRGADMVPAEIDRIHRTLQQVLWCFGGTRRRFFNKNPQLLPHLRWLADLFPDARFIHIVRDPRACANSMVKLYRLEQAQLARIRASGGHGIYDHAPYVAFPRLPRLAEYVAAYGADSIQTTARLWRDAADEVEQVKACLPSFHQVRYEDLLASPAREIGRIIEFCQLPAVAPDHAAFWSALASVGTVHHRNQYGDYEVIEALCGEAMARYGYLDGPATRGADGPASPAPF